MKPPQRPTPTLPKVRAIPTPELPTAAVIPSAGFGTKSAFTAPAVPAPDSTTLSPPVTLTYSGGSPVLLVNDSGTNKGIESLITDSHNSTSALFGQANGSGAGLTGYNSGTRGPAGKFGITNANSSAPAVFTTTNGTGFAIFAAVEADNGQAAIVGQNTALDNYGTGVEGLGGEYGVQGYGTTAGLYGTSDTYGLFAYSAHGTGAYGASEDGTGIGLYAYGQSYRAISAET